MKLLKYGVQSRKGVCLKTSFTSPVLLSEDFLFFNLRVFVVLLISALSELEINKSLYVCRLELIKQNSSDDCRKQLNRNRSLDKAFAN